jgi:hypothetical protein
MIVMTIRVVKISEDRQKLAMVQLENDTIIVIIRIRVHLLSRRDQLEAHCLWDHRWG